MRYFYVICVTVLLCHCVTARTLASESALSASPAILETVLSLDTPTLTSVTIQNNTSFPLPIKGSASAFLANETILEGSKDTFNASRWFTLDPADFILQPNEVKKIEVTITPPKDAEPGGHYATLYFRPLIPQDVVSTSTTISLARIGILAMMIVPGDIITSLTTSPLYAPLWSSFGPVNFLTTFTNNGSIHLLPKSTLTIKNIWGKVVAEISSDPSIILPQTSKEQYLAWDKKIGFGPYTASLTTTYGTDQVEQVSEVVTTWLIPWPILLLVICILTLMYKILIVNRKRLILAIAVLRGKYEPPETTQKNPSNHSSTRRRTHSPHSTQHGRRSPRR